MTPHITKIYNMSRKITTESINAFLNKKPFAKSNMIVEIDGNITYLKLFNNKIAALLPNGRLWISNAGWDSNTTKERLNGLPGVRVYKRKKVWYLNDMQWDGSPIFIDTITN
jgi:hypothetical protein